MNFINTQTKNYYVLIKINNNTDLDLVNNKVQVIGIYSSRENAEIKINNLLTDISNNLNPKYIIHGPFTPDMSTSIIRSNPRLMPDPDIFNPDIYNSYIYNPDLFHRDLLHNINPRG